MKRLTTAGEKYKAEQLRLLQAYEDTGLTPQQIVAKFGRGDVKELDLTVPHRIEVVNPQDKPSKCIVSVDNEQMHISYFSKMIGKDEKTVKVWLRYGKFEEKMRGMGLID